MKNRVIALQSQDYNSLHRDARKYLYTLIVESVQNINRANYSFIARKNEPRFDSDGDSIVLLVFYSLLFIETNFA